MSSLSDCRAVMDAIRQIVHSLELGSRAAQKTLGLSGAQLFVLQTLATGEPMTINQLAAQSHTHQSSVSVVVSRLVQSRLVKRAPARHDARCVELTVTPAGHRTLQTDFITPQQRLFAALGQLQGKRLKTLRSLLQELVTLSGMDGETPPMFLEERDTFPRVSFSRTKDRTSSKKKHEKSPLTR